MAVMSKVPPPTLSTTRGSIFVWLLRIACIGLLAFLLGRMAFQFLMPPPTHRLLLVRDIPLPGALPDKYRTSQHPAASGVALLFDHFDFQALDEQTHLLFIAHTGPSPDREQQVNPAFNPAKDAKTDGNIVVFDTLQKKVVGLLNIPQVAGVVVAPDLHKVYAADANDGIVYVIDERTLTFEPIELQQNDSPDSLEYDQPDHLLFVSVPGAPSNPDKSNVVDKKNQNVNVIDTLTDKVVARVPLGIDGQWGDDVGHVRFDAGLHRLFVVIQQLANPDDPNPNLLPPPGTAWFVEIDPLTHKVVTRVKLPDSCILPHGVMLDTEQHIGFVACIDASPPSLYRVDLRTMQVIAEHPYPLPVKPDIVAIDRSLHVLYVGCAAGVALFQEEGRTLKWLANYSPGVNTHSIAINQETHEVYLPLVRVGGRPVLRIMQYNPDGIG